MNLNTIPAHLGGFAFGYFLGIASWCLGAACAKRMRGGNLGAQRLIWNEGRTTPSDWRRSFNHENFNRPSGPPPLRLRRSGELGPPPMRTLKPNIEPKGQGPR